MKNLFRPKYWSIPQAPGPAGTSWWSWSRRRSPEARYISAATARPTSPGEAKKSITSKSFFSLLGWHFWTIFPCTVTGVLLFLNISKYTIGAEIGKSPQTTLTALAALQLAAKAHEAMITVGLVNIARQWIQGYLISNGTILGLLGAEKSLANLSLLFSKEYMAAVSYSVYRIFHWGKEKHIKEEQGQRKKVFLLVVFLFIQCLLCIIVGPASAVLMIPRLGWFSAKGPDPSWATFPTAYPNIFVDSRVGNSTFNKNFFSFSYPLLYNAWACSDFIVAVGLKHIHKYDAFDVPITVNTSTTSDRPLVVGANWAGTTNFSTVMWRDLVVPGIFSAEYKPISENRIAKFTANLTGIESNTVCRQRRKQSCTLGSSTLNPANASEWCYNAVTKETDEGQLETSRNLLLVTDYMPTISGTLPRLWMTEGLRMTRNKKFTDAIVFVFEHVVSPGLLTVCSTSATLRSATVLSTGKVFSGGQFQLHEYLAYFDGNSTVYRPPRTLLYHENFLDFVHEALPNGTSPVRGGRNITYLPRAGSQPTENNMLKTWAISILNPTSYRSRFWLTDVLDESYKTQASSVELAVGGAYMAMLMGIRPSDSQYSQGLFRCLTPAYPEDLMPEAILNYSSYIYPPIMVYDQAYMYGFSSRADYLSMAILIMHLIVALLGSLWQFQKGSVIRAWTSIPEYGTLCLGSDISSIANGTMQNTCAGIDSKETLKTIVKIGETSADHLELREPGVKMKDVERFKKYGFLGHRRKEKLD